MSSRGGRGRGISNEPAWMTRDGRDSGRDQPPPRDRDRDRDRDFRRPSGGSGSRYDPRYDRRDYSRDRRGGGGRYRGGDRDRDRDRLPPARCVKAPGIYFHSYEEERAWVEERRRKRRERKSLFDVQPTEEQIAMEELQKAALASHGPNPNVFLRPEDRPGAAMSTTGIGGGSSVTMQPQQTRHARRLYIGQLSPALSEEDIHSFFRESIYTALGSKDQSLQDDPILNVYINHERHFAFIEFKTMDICTACLALNGINVRNKGKVIIKRPNDYNAAIAPPPNPEFMKRFNVSQLGIISPVVPDSPNKIFIGGLPYHLNDDQVMELLSAFGRIKAFHLVKADASAVTSKGYCFVEYIEQSHRDLAVMGLNGMDMGGGKLLTAKIASERLKGEGEEVGTAALGATSINVTPIIPSGGHSASGVSLAPPIMRHVDGIDIEMLVDIAMGITPGSKPTGNASSGLNGNGRVPSAPAPASNGVLDIANAALAAAYGSSSGLPSQSEGNGSNSNTRILVLHNMVSDEDFASDEDYEGLKEEVKEECEKFGNLISMKIPHPQKDNFPPSSLKKIFLEYATVQDATNAGRELSGRQFGSNVVATTYFSEMGYANGQLS